MYYERRCLRKGSAISGKAPVAVHWYEESLIIVVANLSVMGVVFGGAMEWIQTGKFYN